MSSYLDRRDMIEEIKDFVCIRYGVPKKIMMSTKRTKKVAEARQMAIALAYELSESSTTEVGEEFNRDHSTVCTTVNKVSNSYTYLKLKEEFIDEHEELN